MSELGTQTLQAKLTRYTLKQRVGAGGMATVYRAWDKNLERDVAIKVLHEHLSIDNTFQERFEREAKFVAGFHHPHIVQIFDFAMIDNEDIPIFYMVMPFLTGETLEHVIETHGANGRTMPLDDIIRLISEIASALDYAHARGMIHRDVKPANILYDSYGSAILTDFGIARLAESNNLTAEGMTIGTPAYMPPEQAQGIEIDHRADIYSLGVIAYELLTGNTPYGDGSVSVMLQHINAAIPDISDYLEMPNQMLDVVIRRVMAKLPDDRYQSASEFADDLEKAIKGETISNPPQPTQVFETVQPAPDKSKPDYEDDKPKRKEKASSQSPLGLFAMGMGLLAFVLVVALVMQMTQLSAETELSDDVVADSMTGDLFFETDFDGSDDYAGSWDDSDAQFLERNIVDGQYIITNNRENTATTSLFDPAYTYNDATITMEAHLVDADSSASAYGIVFRYIDGDNYNVFAVDGRGRYSIWVRNSGEWVELRDDDETWTPNDAVNQDTESNILTIDINDNVLTGYVNGIQVTQVEDDTIAEGAIGIYLATTRQGMAEVSIDRFAVAESVSFASAMTDDSEDFSEAMTDDG